jgi:outer membrane lipoprotein SlyB
MNYRLIALLLALLLASCSSTKNAISRMELGRVVHILVDMAKRDIDHSAPLLTGAQMGIMGSFVGSGTTASVIGAASGILVGTGLGYLSESGSSSVNYTTVIVRADTGVTYRVRTENDVMPPPRIGQRIWITFDKKGIASRLLPASADSAH